MIAQVKAPRNERAEAYVEGVAEIWLRRQIRTHGLPDMRRRRLPAPDARRWQDVVAPLVEAGRLPAWADTAPTNRELTQGELEFTILGCRLRTRGWRFG